MSKSNFNASASTNAAPRPIDSKLQVLCDILNSGQGGFFGLLKREGLGFGKPAPSPSNNKRK
jgi:hypothetical protein